MLFSGAWGKMIHEKNLKQKISWHSPFKIKDTAFEIRQQRQLLFHVKQDLYWVLSY